MSRVMTSGCRISMERSASFRTALSAHPPPTQPKTSFPWASMMAFDPRRADEEPSTPTTVATAKVFPWAISSAAFA